jgi:hypothetical protein
MTSSPTSRRSARARRRSRHSAGRGGSPPHRERSHRSMSAPVRGSGSNVKRRSAMPSLEISAMASQSSRFRAGSSTSWPAVRSSPLRFACCTGREPRLRSWIGRELAARPRRRGRSVPGRPSRIDFAGRWSVAAGAALRRRGRRWRGSMWLGWRVGGLFDDRPLFDRHVVGRPHCGVTPGRLPVCLEPGSPARCGSTPRAAPRTISAACCLRAAAWRPTARRSAPSARGLTAPCRSPPSARSLTPRGSVTVAMGQGRSASQRFP